MLLLFELAYYLPSPRASSLLTRKKKKACERVTTSDLLHNVHSVFPDTQAKHTDQIHKAHPLKNHTQEKKKPTKNHTDQGTHIGMYQQQRSHPSPHHQCFPRQSAGCPSPGNPLVLVTHSSSRPPVSHQAPDQSLTLHNPTSAET